MRAIVLAGGKGQRLWPLTQSTPKAMINVAEKPLIEHHLKWLIHEGVNNVILACGHHGEVIRQYIDENPVRQLTVTYSFEDHPLGRGGAARLAFKALPPSDQPCIISQSDIISDVPLRKAYQAHVAASVTHKIILTLVLVPYRSRYGVVEVGQSGLITRFREKPRLPYWANTGIFIASPEFFRLLPKCGDEDSVIEYLAKNNKVDSFCTSFYSRTVDTLKDIQEAEFDLALPSLPHEQVY